MSPVGRSFSVDFAHVTNEPGALSQCCPTPPFGQGSYAVLLGCLIPKTSVGRIVCLRAVLARVLSKTGEMLEGPCCEVLPLGFCLLVLLAQSCDEEEACLAPSLRRIVGDVTT